MRIFLMIRCFRFHPGKSIGCLFGFGFRCREMGWGCCQCFFHIFDADDCCSSHSLKQGRAACKKNL